MTCCQKLSKLDYDSPIFFKFEITLCKDEQNSHYKAWSYKKKKFRENRKDKKSISYRHTVIQNIGQIKAFSRQRSTESSCEGKEKSCNSNHENDEWTSLENDKVESDEFR